MKILKYIVWSFLLFFAVFYFLPAGLLQVPSVQKKISRDVSTYLEGKLHTDVSIGRINFELFNKLIIKDIYAEDESGDILFQAKRLSAGFEFFPLFKKQFRIHSLLLYTFECNLSKEADGSPLNIQYIIDAFSSGKGPDKNPSIDLSINTIDFRRGAFSYKVENAGKTPGKFNPKDIFLKDISAKIHLNSLNSKELNMKVNRLDFSEQSGLTLKKLTFDVYGNKDFLRLDQLFIQLDKTALRMKDILADYSVHRESNKGAESILFQMEIEPSEIYPEEISAFIPAFSRFNDKVDMAGKLGGTLDSLNLTNFYVRDGEHFSIYTSTEIKNLVSNPENLYLKGKTKDTYISPEGLDRLLNNFMKEAFTLPPEIYNIRTIHAQIEFEGTPHQFSVQGNLNSAVGNLETNIVIGKDTKPYIKGYLASPSLDMGALLNNKDLGDVAFEVHLDAQQNLQKQFEGEINALIEQFSYKGHAYENLSMNGEFSRDHFKGLLDFDSPEGQLKAEGLFVFQGENPGFQFQLKVDDLQLEELNFTDKYKGASLSLLADANFTGNELDDILGDIYFREIDFLTEEGRYRVDSLWINASPTEAQKKILVRSPLLNGEIYGIYSYRNIVPAIKRSLSNYLPSLVAYNPRTSGNGESSFYLDFQIEPTDSLSSVFQLPFAIQSQSRIQGQYNSIYDKFHLEIDIPQATAAGSSMQELNLKLGNPAGKVELYLSGINLQKKDNRMAFQVKMDAVNDSVSTSMIWGNTLSKYKGNLNLDAIFARLGKDSYLQTKIQFQPSDLIFNDSIWTLNPVEVRIDSSNIRIVDNLRIAHENQFVNIRGAVSHVPEEELSIQLNQVDLDYIFKSLGKSALTFGGIATGTVNAKDPFQTRELSTKLDVKNFSFNEVAFGDLNLTGTWDDESQGILMDGWVYKNDSTTVDVDGVIFPVKEELSINFDAKNTDARFLRKYLDGFIPNVTGELTGKIRLFGDLNTPTVEGKAFARDFRFLVEYLNTYYSFTDSIVCLPDEIIARNITISDDKGNTGRINGSVKHHLFEDFSYSANMNFTDLMVFNATKSSNPIFYGLIYGTGSANLYGTEDVVNIDVNMRNTGNSKITLNFMEESDVMDYDFINFIKRKPDTLAIVSPKSTNSIAQASSGTEIRSNLIMEVTPEANIEMIMDPLRGDKITAYGNGNMQVQYGTKIPMRVFGNYRLNRGEYNFSLEQAFFRNFDIQEGSEVVFRGDPYVAELNIDARYTVTANLGDLDQALVRQNYSARNNIPVDCILLLTGPLNHPSIAFDLNLPGATSELNRQVKSYIRTEDMMNRQMVYLLALGRFYTSPEYATGNYNNDYSYLTSALSTQLSNLLGNLSDKFQIGTKFHQTFEGEQTSTEVELLLSSQLLNDRLIINGNFAYLDNPYVNTTNQNIPLVGDFDIEYKLSKSGDIRLRGFNHYNYRNYFSQTPEMTQGLGILFRKDFDRFSDLFSRWLRSRNKEEKE